MQAFGASCHHIGEEIIFFATNLLTQGARLIERHAADVDEKSIRMYESIMKSSRLSADTEKKATGRSN